MTDIQQGLPRSEGMNTITIQEMKTRADRKRFVRMAYPLYANDPNWVAPLEIRSLEFLDPKRHPFLQHGTATQFLAIRDGQAVGRILVSEDPHYQERNGTKTGHFGMFESIRDPTVSRALFDTAAAWHKARGNTELLGPIDYSMNYPCGLLVDGFDTPPRLMMNHNPPWYEELVEDWGMEKAKDLWCWWFRDDLMLLDKWKRRADWLKKRLNVTIRPVNLSRYGSEIEELHSVYDAAFRQSWGTVQLTEAEFRYLGKEMCQIGDPKNVPIAQVDGEVVGFAVTLPDLNEAIAPLHGRLTTFGIPIGAARLLYRMRHIKTGRMLVLVMLEEYRGRGIEQLLIHETCRYGKEVLRYTGAELSWTLEDNDVINRTITTVGGHHYKTYRLYRKNL